MVRSIEEVLYRPEVGNHVMATTLLSPATVVRYDVGRGFPPWFRREKAFDARNLYLLRDVFMGSRTGQIWTPGGALFAESVGSPYRILGWEQGFDEIMLQGAAIPVLSEVPVVASPPAGYFHWLMEVLPGLIAALEHYPEATVLLHPNSPGYVSEALQLLSERDTDRTHRETIVSPIPVRACRAVLPGREAYSGFIQLEDVERIRESLRVSHGSRAHRLIYVSRRGTTRRSLENEPDVEAELERRGFEIIRAEQLTLRAQIELFSEARVVIGPHGAGLANLVWCPAETRVVELFPAGIFNDCYARLACVRGLSYWPLECAPSSSSHGIVPISKLRKVAVAAMKGQDGAVSPFGIFREDRG
ncbi:MAG: glycosyltransferase 61 family protein [Gemmatimonadota bacterium]